MLLVSFLRSLDRTICKNWSVESKKNTCKLHILEVWFLKQALKKNRSEMRMPKTCAIGNDKKTSAGGAWNIPMTRCFFFWKMQRLGRYRSALSLWPRRPAPCYNRPNHRWGSREAKRAKKPWQKSPYLDCPFIGRCIQKRRNLVSFDNKTTLWAWWWWWCHCRSYHSECYRHESPSS